MAEEKNERAGYIEWKVTGDLLEQFKTAKHKQVFCSPEFRTMDGTIWRIQFYPHGVTSPDDCSIYLESVTLNPNKPRIGVNYSFNIIEVEWDHDMGDTFPRDGQTWGRNNIFKREKLDNLERLTINCFVEETMNVQNGNKYFEWNISHHLMRKCKNAKYKKWFFSPRFNAIGAEWYLDVYPNGRSTEGTAAIDIHCHSIESKKEEIDLCYYIEIEAMNYCTNNFNGETVKKGKYIECGKGFQFNELRKLSEIVIYIKIWEKGCLDTTEEELMLTKEKVITLKKEVENIRAKSVEIKEIKNESKILKKEIKNLQKENSSLKEELKKIKAKSVEMKEIKNESQNDTKRKIMRMSHDRFKKEKEKEYNSRIQIHDDRLGEWRVETIKIEKELKCLVNDDDEKEENIDTKQLLNKYIECKSLCEKQELRMEETAMYCLKLNKFKKILKEETTKQNEKLNKNKNIYQDLKLKYSQLKTKRISLQMEWDQTLKKLNDIIDQENKLNKQEYIAFNEYNICNLEMQSLNTTLDKLKVLMKDYRAFDAKNALNMEEIKQIFDKQWIECIKNWYKWTPDDIVCWFKYLENENELRLSKELNFDDVLNEMKRSKMNGFALKSMDKTDLKTVGFITLNDRQQIYRKIRELISKYPHNRDDNKESYDVEGQRFGMNIPKEFLCPLSKQIMKEPVTIFDDHTYEKVEIERYLKKYNKSPITGEQCDDDDHWTVPNRKLKQKIKIFLATNDNVSLECNETNLIK